MSYFRQITNITKNPYENLLICQELELDCVKFNVIFITGNYAQNVVSNSQLLIHRITTPTETSNIKCVSYVFVQKFLLHAKMSYDRVRV